MRKSNGFVFMETIVVVSVLSVTLMSLFSTFSFLLRKARERETYDTTAYIYKTYMVISELETQSIHQSINGMNRAVEHYISIPQNNCTCYDLHSDTLKGELCSSDSINSGNHYRNYFVSCDLTENLELNDLKLMAEVYNIEKIYWVVPKDLKNYPKERAIFEHVDATSIDYLRSKSLTEDRLFIVKYKTKYNGLSNTNKEDAIFFASLVVDRDA